MDFGNLPAQLTFQFSLKVKDFYENDARAASAWGQHFRILVAQDDEVEAHSEETIKTMIEESHARLLRSPSRGPN